MSSDESYCSYYPDSGIILMFHIFIEFAFMSNSGILLFLGHDTTEAQHELTFLRKGGPDISFFLPSFYIILCQAIKVSA